MRIKKIELIGFKSFADRTEIQLGEGVTCVVGPNGCGKSNISDAIRWVFGERSAKLLRGTRMEDVIFSGTEFRKPTNMAEVSLVVDNHDRRLPIEYEEVVLTRRLYRSGQSEYFINRTSCRLRDILDLILDTGMGSNSYSMIEQGQVDQVIQANPRERRFLIEEAAGISKYKVKKEEALRKLDRTEQNLLRIRDILGEVQKNIQYAERQARRAERYKTQFDELKHLEISKAFGDLKILEDGHSRQENMKSGLLEEARQLEEKIHMLQQKQEQEEKNLQQIINEEGNQSTACDELKSELKSLVQKLEFNRERFEEFKRRTAEIGAEREILQSNLEALVSDLNVKIEEIRSAREEFQSAGNAYQNNNADFHQTEERFRYTKEELEKLKQEVFESAARGAQLNNEVSRLRALMQTLERDQTRRKEALGKLRTERQQLDIKRLAGQEELSNVGQMMTASSSGQQTLAVRLSGARRRKEALRSEIEDKKIRLRELSSRLTLLQELAETSQSQEQRLLSCMTGNRLRGKVIKNLRDVLRIKAGYESAVEAVLGRFAQALIAEDIDTAQGLIQEMNESHLGPFGIFIQSLVKSNAKYTAKANMAHHQIKHSIYEVVEVQQGFEPLFEPLFHDVYVVEDFIPEQLGELLPYSKQATLVTRQGILIGPESRVLFRNGRLTPDQGSFQRQSEIRQLCQAIQALNEEIGGGESNQPLLEEEIASLEGEQSTLEAEGQDSHVRRKATEFLLHEMETRWAATAEEMRILDFEIEEAGNEANQFESKIRELEECASDLNKKGSHQQEALSKAESSLVEFQKERDISIHDLTRLKTMLENHERGMKTLEASRSLIEAQSRSIKERIQRLVQEDKDSQRRCETIACEDQDVVRRKEQLVVLQNKAESVLGETRGRRGFQQQHVRKETQAANEATDKLKELRDRLHQEELKAMELSFGMKSLHERILQTYGVKLQELKAEEYVIELDLGTVETKIQALKERVEAFGPVNLLAVDEYEELKHRFDFLSAQEKDLNEARESLLEAIRKINRTTKTLFKETFEKAQALFQEYYQTLFNGGRAELVLLEGEETEESGIDIMVRPPGKKPQHISLLSGGEKALTAMALLFALFRIKPSPMCVLDEVDAPLDEANVDRFIKVLRTFIGSTQYVIVTHNRKTIAMGDCLYGVTMEEAGVSKVVSVKVAESSRNAEVPVEQAAAA